MLNIFFQTQKNRIKQIFLDLLQRFFRKLNSDSLTKETVHQALAALTPEN